MAVSILLFCLFAGFGFLFSRGQGAALIAGYNTMPPENQKNVDETKLFKFMGNLMYALAFCTLLFLLSDLLNLTWLSVAGVILFLGTLAAGLFYGNTGDRFVRKV